MEVIRDRDGNVIGRSRNLRGIRSYVSNHIITTLAIDELPHGEGKLCILFDNETSFETNFASYTALQDFVRKWRNVYGAPLVINGFPVGKVHAKHIMQENSPPLAQ